MIALPRFQIIALRLANLRSQILPFWLVGCIATVLYPLSASSCAQGPELNYTEGISGSSQPATCNQCFTELWVISSRGAPKCSNLDVGFEYLNYQKWDSACNVFQSSNREELLQCESEMPSLLFVHGNSLDAEESMSLCWDVHRRVKRCSGPKRLIFWSWPSEAVYKRPLIRPVKTIRKNVNAKYTYAENQGYYISKLANMLSLSQPVTLGGHSFGGLAVVSALHYLGGGVLNGRTGQDATTLQRSNLRAAIVAAAIDNDALYPGCRYGNALMPVESFLTTFNPRDSILRRWPTLSSRGKEAVGFTGICASRLGCSSHKLIQVNMTEETGRAHDMRSHLASARMISAICRTAFPEFQSETLVLDPSSTAHRNKHKDVSYDFDSSEGDSGVSKL